MKFFIERILKGERPTLGRMIVRALAGGYLVYLAKVLYSNRLESGINPYLYWCFIILFLIMGLFLCVKVIHNYATGYYEGGQN